MANSVNKVQKALELAGNDREKAKKLVSGELKDVRTVKGRFSIEAIETYSIFMLFFNKDDGRLMNISLAVFTDESVYQKIKIANEWRLFYTVLKQTKTTPSLGDSSDLIVHMAESIEGYELSYDVEEGNTENISDTLIEIIAKSFNIDSVQCEVELEEMCSMDMLDLDIAIDKVPRLGETAALEKPDIEKNAQFVIESTLVIAPVNGKYIHDVQEGDLLKVVFVNKDEITKKVAQALKGIDENGEYKPVKGRVIEITSLGKDGTRLYCLVAKNILAKIIEEENVKVELFEPGKQQGEKKPTLPVSKVVIYLLSLAIAIIVTVILIAIII